MTASKRALHALAAGLFLAVLLAAAPDTRAETRSVTFPTAFRPNTLNNVAPSSSAPLAFVGSRDTDTVFAFDPRNGSLLGSVEVGDGPLFVTMFETPQRRVLAVTCDGFFGAAGNFVAFVDATDPAQMRLTGVADLPDGYIFLLGYQTLRFAPDGQMIFVTGSDENNGRGVLFAFDSATQAEIGRVDIGLAPGSIDLADTGSRLIVALTQSVAPRGRVTIVDATNPAAMTALRTIRLPKKSGLYNVNNVELSEDGAYGFVASGDGDAMFSFEVDTGRVLARVPLGSFPTFSRAFLWNGQPRLLVVSEASAAAVVLDVSDPAHPQFVSTNAPSAIFLDVPPSVTGDGGTAFVASTDQNRVYAFDTVTGAQRYSFSVGERPVATAVWQGGAEPVVCVVGATSADITLLRSDANAFFDLGRFRGPGGSAQFTLYQNAVISRDGRFAFVASRSTNELLAIDLTSAEVAGRVAVSQKPSRIALAENPSGESRRVAVLGSDGVFSVIDAADPSHMTVTATSRLETPYRFFLEFANIVTTFDGATAFVADGYQFVYAIDMRTGQVAGTVGTGFIPITVSLREDRGRKTLAVLNAQDGSTSVAVVDVTNPAAMSLISATPIPEDGLVALNNVPRFSIDGRFVYVGASISEVVFTIDAENGGIAGKVAATSAVTPAPYAAGGVQSFAAVNLAGDPISVFNLKTSGKPRRAATIESLESSFFLVGNEPFVKPDGSAAYVPNFGRASLLAFDPVAGIVTGELPLGKGPGPVTIDEATGTFVALEINGSSSRILIGNLAEMRPLTGGAREATPAASRPTARSRGIVPARPEPDSPVRVHETWLVMDNGVVTSRVMRSKT